MMISDENFIFLICIRGQIKLLLLLLLNVKKKLEKKESYDKISSKNTYLHGLHLFFEERNEFFKYGVQHSLVVFFVFQKLFQQQDIPNRFFVF